MASEVCVDKGMCRSQTAKSPVPGSAKMQAKQKEWIMTIVSLCIRSPEPERCAPVCIECTFINVASILLYRLAVDNLV